MTLLKLGRFIALMVLVGGSGGCGSGSLGSPDGSSGSGGAAGSAAPPTLQARVEAAISTWATAKSGCPTYSYDRRQESVFGYASSTQVQIENDVGTIRRFSTYSPPPGNVAAGGTWTLQWEEGGTYVGAHSEAGGAFPASTMEQLLSECVAAMAHDPAMNTLTLQMDTTTGVPTVCLYEPHNCADDCQFGIRIAAFACAPLTPNGPS